MTPNTDRILALVIFISQARPGLSGPLHLLCISSMSHLSQLAYIRQQLETHLSRPVFVGATPFTPVLVQHNVLIELEHNSYDRIRAGDRVIDNRIIRALLSAVFHDKSLRLRAPLSVEASNIIKEQARILCSNMRPSHTWLMKRFIHLGRKEGETNDLLDKERKEMDDARIATTTAECIRQIAQLSSESSASVGVVVADTQGCKYSISTYEQCFSNSARAHM
jgi:hypothetical protein